MSSPRVAWLNKNMNCKVTDGIGIMKRSKSLCAPYDVFSDVSAPKENGHRYSRTVSDSSESTIVSDCEAGERGPDSGIERTLDGELDLIQQKIDQLSDMCMEQCRLLNTMKDEIGKSRAFVSQADFEQNEIISELLKKSRRQSVPILEAAEDSRAKCLLDAIEGPQLAVDREIRDVLISFLQSEDLKERMVQATAASVQEVIESCLSRDISALYLPLLQHAHHRLLRHVARTVEDAFLDLEEYTACLSKSVSKVSRSLTQAVERHKALLDAAADPRKNLVSTLRCTVEELLSKELKQWKQKVLDTFKFPVEPVQGLPEFPNFVFPPTSTPQLANPMAVEICNQIERGEVNAAFERALIASDLSLVMLACRSAAWWGSAFAPRCQLRQDVLMALMQQLSTDMVHDTQLKCRYLEDAIIHLDPRHLDTRQYLSLAVGEVRKHLSAFLAAWPNHLASRRIRLIIMAADSLLKQCYLPRYLLHRYMYKSTWVPT